MGRWSPTSLKGGPTDRRTPEQQSASTLRRGGTARRVVSVSAQCEANRGQASHGRISGDYATPKRMDKPRPAYRDRTRLSRVSMVIIAHRILAALPPPGFAASPLVSHQSTCPTPSTTDARAASPPALEGARGSLGSGRAEAPPRANPRPGDGTDLAAKPWPGGGRARGEHMTAGAVGSVRVDR
jgi:hypothetical protein